MASVAGLPARVLPGGMVAMPVYTAVYVALAALSLSTAYVQANAAAVWIPSGYSVGLLIVLGLRYWPVVAVGSCLTNFAVNVTDPAGVSVHTAAAVAFVIASGNVCEALLGAYLTRRFAAGREFLARTRSFAAFALLAVPLPAMISMTVGVAASQIGGLGSRFHLPEVVLTWYIANSVGILVFASLTCLVLTQPVPRLSVPKTLEALLLFACLAFFSQAICGIYWSQSLGDWPKSYMVVPFLLWACFRFGTYGALLSIVLITAISVSGTMQGYLAFPAQTPARALIYLQIYLGMLAAMAISVSAALCEVNALRTSLEEKVRARTKGIEDLLREREALTSIVAHDLQSPLYGVRNALRAAAEAIKAKRLSSDEIVSAMGMMAETCSTLAERVAGLLAPKGGETLTDAAIERDAPLATVLDRILSAHQPGIERKAAQVSLEGDMKIAISRPTEIEYILDILVDNAIKHSPKGSRIEVAAYRHGSSIEILVADRGQGVAAHAAKKLFFPRLLAALAPDASGSGMGLYLASERAAKLGGRLTYSQVQPTGARFRLVLPA